MNVDDVLNFCQNYFGQDWDDAGHTNEINEMLESTIPSSNRELEPFPLSLYEANESVETSPPELELKPLPKTPKYMFLGIVSPSFPYQFVREHAYGDKIVQVDGDTVEEEPLSPVAQLFQSTRLYCPIIYLLGSKTLIDVDAIKFGFNVSFVKHPRFSSLLVTDDKNGGQMSWRRTEVDIHNHVYTPELDPNMESPDTYVEDYVSNLTNTGFDLAKPLWELHVLNVQTSDASATAVLKYHHSIGDGISFISLLLASSRKASDLESMPSRPRTKRPTSFWNNRHGFWEPIFTICTMILMAFNTFVDMMHVAATALFFKDTDTPMKGVPAENVGLSCKRIVHRIVSFHDIELVKSAMNATINDVLLGITMAALSRYLNRRYGKSALAFNLRPYPGTLPLAEMMKKEAKVRWGNLVTAVLIPITIALLDDPLDYVRKAKAIVDTLQENRA
ncbi:Wax synthase [Heracleum sosnowskyi]|uniref:Wax synthase n=1 Tax=Heracleum sosnowskyi TaxID=360622 RepID=A0AAD8IUT5_9APIA|nr:Wax synthase [Heracleum sosnowskyi]